MAFKFIVLVGSVLAYANAGLIGQQYSVAPAVSSVYSSIGAPSVLSTRTLITPGIKSISALPTISAGQAYAGSPLLGARLATQLNTGLPIASLAGSQLAYGGGYSTQLAASPIAIGARYAAPLAAAPLTRIAYSPANQVSQVYSSIAAPAALSYAPQIAYANPAIASTQQNTIRTLGGTVSSYSKAIDTAFSSVRKSDTRVSNNYYAPALATRTIALAPAYATKTVAIAPAAIGSSYLAPSSYLAGSSAIHGSPVVSHVSFDGIGAHYGW